MAIKILKTEGIDEIPDDGDELRFSISLVKQGEHRFFTFSMPSKVLAACSFTTTKDEDPIAGFQRVLDVHRAQEIADYIDLGGTIPNSIVLSAQPGSGFRSIGGGKTAAFKFSPYSFLILDGQHRVYGFSKARTAFRVPVVVYESLTREQEARLFIDINTKQKPVPRELLLAIKSLARTEDDVEAQLGQVFDLFNQDAKSALLSRTSSIRAESGKINRVTFNAGLRQHLHLSEGKAVKEIYDVWNAYFHAIMSNLRGKKVERAIANKVVFRAFCEVFPDVIQRVGDRYKRKYTIENFSAVISPIFDMPSTSFSSPRAKQSSIAEDYRKRMKATISI